MRTWPGGDRRSTGERRWGSSAAVNVEYAADFGHTLATFWGRAAVRRISKAKLFACSGKKVEFSSHR